MSGEVSGHEAFDETTGLLTGEVGEDDEMKRTDGASCLSVTSPGLRGYIQHFKSSCIFGEVSFPLAIKRFFLALFAVSFVTQCLKRVLIILFLKARHDVHWC